MLSQTATALSELTRCSVFCDLILITFRSQKSSSITCSKKLFHFGAGPWPHVGKVVLPNLEDVDHQNAGTSGRVGKDGSDDSLLVIILIHSVNYQAS